MRKLLFVFLVLSLLVTLGFVYKGNIPAVKASSSIHQGDLILTGNNVTTIEGGFDINGSIIVEDNATLFLKDAFLTFTQTEAWQYNIALGNPSNGNPRLLAYNSTITSYFAFNIILEENSTATIDHSIISHFLSAYDYSIISISNSSHVSRPRAWDSSIINVYNSTITEWHNYDSPDVQVYDSGINSLLIGPMSVNCTISKLKPGLISYWSFITNCSVKILSGGSTPNITLTNTNVGDWRFAFYGESNAAILNSTIWDAAALGLFGGPSVIYLKSTTCHYLYADFSSVLWLLNSTYTDLNIWDLAKVYVSWYLDVHVIDSIGQDVPSANVTATYPNATVAESKLTDAQGWARLTLMEKMINPTGEYPVGNYTVEATYEIYSDATTVNMTENKQIILTLEDFIIPEFPSFLLLPLFMIATLLAVIVYRRKHSM